MSSPKDNSPPSLSNSADEAEAVSLTTSSSPSGRAIPKLASMSGALRKKPSGSIGSVSEERRVATESTKPKVATSSSVHKASGIQSFEKSSAPMKRTRSAQNISRSASVAVPQSAASGSRGSALVKRAASSQNVSAKSRQRLSGPPAIAVAYNAELLASFEKEKRALERRISELIQVAETRKTETERLRFEVKALRERSSPSENVFEELELLRQENRDLRSRLLELNVSVEHFTDSEKLSILQQKSNAARDCFDPRGSGGGGPGFPGSDSAAGVKFRSASDADARDVESLGELAAAERMSCLSLDGNWDRQSNKSSEGGQSEVSVACLQDRILQMEESHYSTNEELQATLQELTDLQDAVNELSAENALLADEKNVLLESLCAQTEKLENARLQVEHLKALLLRDSEYGERSENERQLVALVKSAQEEKEELLLKQVEFGNAVHAYEQENDRHEERIAALAERLAEECAKADGAARDRKALQSQVAAAKDQSIRDQLESQRLRALLDNEKQKLAELEQERSATSKSELETLVDAMRQEKDRLEERLTNAEQELAARTSELSQMREALEAAREELDELKTGAATRLFDAENRLNVSERERAEALEELESAHDRAEQLELAGEQEKKTYTMAVARMESELRIARSKVSRLDAELRDRTEQFREERDAWTQFQQDLQTAVVIANDIKTEAQEDREQVAADREFLFGQTLALRAELSDARVEADRLRQQAQQLAMDPPTVVSSTDIRDKVLSTVDRELAVRRKMTDAKGTPAPPSLSVRHLISSIEEQVKNEGPSLPPTSTSPSVVAATTTRRNSSVEVASRPSTLRQATSPSSSSDVGLKGLFRRPVDVVDAKDSSRVVAATVTGHRHTIADIIVDGPTVTDDDKQAVVESVAMADKDGVAVDVGRKPLTGILSNKATTATSRRRHTTTIIGDGGERSPDKFGNHLVGHLSKSDPLALLAKQFNCSKRNAILKWCQNKTATYTGIDITNFSSSWNDGLAFCALLHTYLPDKIPYKELNSQDKVRNFTLAFKAAESVGIPSLLNLKEMLATERPDWQVIMSYVTSIYRHFDIDNRS